MAKKRGKTAIEQLIEILKTADLRIRCEIPDPNIAKRIALQELHDAAEALDDIIDEITNQVKKRTRK